MILLIKFKIFKTEVKIRKFVRMLNSKEKLDFTEKIKFSKANISSKKNFFSKIYKIITYLRESE